MLQVTPYLEERKEKLNVKLCSPDCVFRLYDLVSLCIYVMYVMVYLGDGSGIAVMPSVPILVVCITNLILSEIYLCLVCYGPT